MKTSDGRTSIKLTKNVTTGGPDVHLIYRSLRKQAFTFMRPRLKCRMALLFVVLLALLQWAPRRASSITMNSGSTVTVQSEIGSTAGSYPEIVYHSHSGDCTATVIGPYAAVTAAHCAPLTASQNSIVWWGGGPSLTASAVYVNPYRNQPYWPAWWNKLNDAQKASGGRQDDWPAMHDHAMLFLPGLTPTFLAQNGIKPMSVDPNGDTSNLRVAGSGSNEPARQSAPTRFVAATANSITSSRRDGYLTRDGSTANFATADGGDSGGPTFGAAQYKWWRDGLIYDDVRTLIATTQNQVDTAPLAYPTNLLLTANQKDTIRVNALWLQARLDDADGDGLPTECDSDPASGSGSVNLCPDSVGGPMNSSVGSIPIAQLACRAGYVTTGIRGRAGDLIDRLGIKCTAISCFATPFIACSQVNAGEYWTDELGGMGGNVFERTCGANEVIVGIYGTHNDIVATPRHLKDYRLHSLAPICLNYSYARIGASSGIPGSLAGNSQLGSFYRRDCAASRILTGFQARSVDVRYVSGLQPICTSLPAKLTDYAGGPGGRSRLLECPAGQVAIGTVESPEDNAIAMFGILCAPTNLVGGSIPDSQITVVRGGYYDRPSQTVIPPATEPLLQAKLPVYWSSKCPNGSLAGANVKSGNLLNYIDSIICQSTSRTGPGILNNAMVTLHDNDVESITALAPTPAAITSGMRTTMPVGVGTNAGTPIRWSCPGASLVRGLYVRSGYLTDGVALRCQ